MKSLEELKAIREKMQGQVGLRAESNAQTRVVVGMRILLLRSFMMSIWLNREVRERTRYFTHHM